MATQQRPNCLDVEVSLFASFQTNTPDQNPVNLQNWLSSAEILNKYRSRVERVRATADKKKRNELKQQTIPAITPSGTFTIRGNANLVTHTGLLQFDIDEDDNGHIANYAELREQIARLPEVAYCGLSTSGRGYWGLVPIANPDRHEQHFFALKTAFARWGIVLDSQCKDRSRLRGYSIDPEAYFNPYAVPFHDMEEERPRTSQKRCNSFSRPVGDTAEDVEDCISQLEQQQKDIAYVYDDWLAIGFAFAHEFGENGRELFHRVSRLSPKYDDEAYADKKFDSCLKGKSSKPITIATFFGRCRDAAIVPRKRGILTYSPKGIRPVLSGRTAPTGSPSPQESTQPPVNDAPDDLLTPFDDEEPPAPAPPPDVQKVPSPPRPATRREPPAQVLTPEVQALIAFVEAAQLPTGPIRLYGQAMISDVPLFVSTTLERVRHNPDARPFTQEHQRLRDFARAHLPGYPLSWD